MKTSSGKTDFDLFPTELAQKYRQDDQQVVETGRLLEAVEENRSDGETRYVQVMKSAVRDASGEIVGVQVIFWDVTDRKKAEAALEHERYLLHALMDNLPHNIYFKDAHSRFIRINKALADYFGLDDAAEAVGKTDADFFTEEHAQQAMADEQEISTLRPAVARQGGKGDLAGRPRDLGQHHQTAAVRRGGPHRRHLWHLPRHHASRSKPQRNCEEPRRPPRPPAGPRATSWPT